MTPEKLKQTAANLDKVIRSPEIEATKKKKLTFYQIVSESRRINDGKDRIREISKKVALVLTGLFRDGRFAVIEAVHLEAASVEALPVVILVAPHQHVGQA
jgi:DNA-directed RNA polymerase delta subunit